MTEETKGEVSEENGRSGEKERGRKGKETKELECGAYEGEKGEKVMKKQQCGVRNSRTRLREELASRM